MKRLRARFAQALDRRFAAIADQAARQHAEMTQVQESIQSALSDQSARQHEEILGLRESVQDLQAIVDSEIRPVLRSLAFEEAADVRRLQTLRDRDDYDRPWTETEPLVSVCVVTRDDRTDLLLTRTIPSVLEQTYENLELLIVGDAIGSQPKSAIEKIGDPRIRFYNTTHRLVHTDAHRHWLVSSPMARNESRHRANGLWITDLDDDDALRPDAIERLLALSRRSRAEIAYGLVECHRPDGERSTIGGFPPGPVDPPRDEAPPFQVWDGRASTGALSHHGLKAFNRHHVSRELGVPGDFFILERLVKAGARFAMTEHVVYDYYPSQLWGAKHD